MALVCDQMCKQWIDADENTIEQLKADEFEQLTPLQKIQLISLLWQVS